METRANCSGDESQDNSVSDSDRLPVREGGLVEVVSDSEDTCSETGSMLAPCCW